MTTLAPLVIGGVAFRTVRDSVEQVRAEGQVRRIVVTVVLETATQQAKLVELAGAGPAAVVLPDGEIVGTAALVAQGDVGRVRYPKQMSIEIIPL